MAHERIAGQATGPILLVLVLGLGLGGFNYQRNRALEQAGTVTGPYAGYSDQELALYRTAVGEEIEGLRRRHERLRRQRGATIRDRGDLGENGSHFNRTTQKSAVVRDAAGDLAEFEGLKATLDKELASRAQRQATAATGWALHLRRLTTF